MESKRGGKVIEVRPGESVVIDVRSRIDFPKIRLTLEQKSGNRARLRFHAADSVEIEREPRESATLG